MSTPNSPNLFFTVSGGEGRDLVKVGWSAWSGLKVGWVGSVPGVCYPLFIKLTRLLAALALFSDGIKAGTGGENQCSVSSRLCLSVCRSVVSDNLTGDWVCVCSSAFLHVRVTERGCDS